MLNRLSLRYGWRGAWLILMGAVWILFGAGVLIDRGDPRPWVLYEYLPSIAQAAGWWVTGAVAIGQGFRGAGRDDTLGHVALYLMPAVRLFSFAIAWVVFLASVAVGQFVDTPHIGYPQGWYAALIWSLVSLMLGLAASWPNPVTPIPRPPASAIGTD